MSPAIRHRPETLLQEAVRLLDLATWHIDWRTRDAAERGAGGKTLCDMRVSRTWIKRALNVIAEHRGRR